MRTVRFLKRYPASPVSVESLTDLLMIGNPSVSREQYEVNARLIWLRYCNDPPATFAAIAEELGITRDRVRQRESWALRKLRHPARKNRLALISLATGDRLWNAVTGDWR